ncbi:MAG: ThuA domain-containing protein [Terriglobia bacterium]
MRRHTSLPWILVVALAVAFLGGTSPARAATPKKGKLLYMTLTKGWHHDSIELSKQILKEIGEKNGAFDVTVTEDVAAFTAANLKNYDAVVFNTTGELPMDDAEKKAFMDFVRSGHGFIAVHSATDTFYMWGEFGELIGGYFNGHPWHQMVTIEGDHRGGGSREPAGQLPGEIVSDQRRDLPDQRFSGEGLPRASPP